MLLVQIIATKCDALHRGALYHLDSLYFRLKNHFPDIPVVGKFVEGEEF